MQYHKIIRRLVFMLMLITVIIISCTYVFAENIYASELQIKKGFLDATEYDFENDHIISLDGEWEFYWNELLEPDDFKNADVLKRAEFIQVPSKWTSYKLDSFGHATYRLRVKTDSVAPLMVHFKRLDIASKIWINGKLEAQNGKIGKNKEDSKPVPHERLMLAEPSNGELEIIIQVSNYHVLNNGLIKSIEIGSINKILETRDLKSTLNYILIGIYLFASIYHLGLYIIRRKEKGNLWFGLFCGVFTLRNLINSEIAQFIFPKEWLFFLSTRSVVYASLFALITFMLYLISLFPNVIDKFHMNLFKYLSITYFILLTIPSNLLIIEGNALIISVFSSIFTYLFIYLIIKGFKKGFKGSIPLILSTIFFLVIGIHDGMARSGVIISPYLIPYGLGVYILTQVFILASKFTDAFNKVEIFSKELLTVNKLKDEFLANTSHELRTPVHGIIGISESLISGVAGKLPATAIDNLHLIANSGKRMSNLVNDILDFSKMKNSELEISKDSVDLEKITDVTIQVIKTTIENKDLKIVKEMPKHLPPVNGDMNRIQQVMYNLIGNAIKFTESGTVTIKLEPIKEFVKVSIIDTGIGIPQSKINIIFDDFQQADSSTARRFGGTGLGLTITKKIVELHGGEIWVESEEGIGSTFIFTLPIAKEISTVEQNTDNKILKSEFNLTSIKDKEISQDINTALTEENSSFEKPFGRILIVDDEITNQKVLENHLILENFHVEVASSAIEAKEIVENSEMFDLILLDVMMPKISGYEFCKFIREKYSMYELPVILLTAKSRVENIVTGFECGANDYLIKPFDKKELMVRIESLLSLKKAVFRAMEIDKNFESEKEQRKLAENIISTIKEISQTLEINDVLENSLECISNIFKFENAHVLLKNNDQFIISASSQKQEPSDLENKNLIENAKKHFSELSDNDTHNLIHNNFYNPIELSYNEDKYTYIPMINGKLLLGLVVLKNIEKKDAHKNYLVVLLAYVSQITIAFQNANLFTEVKKLATYDDLTSVYNRRSFFQFAEKEFNTAVENKKNISSLMIDIDNFKMVNDSRGHNAGDLVLKSISSILKPVVAEHGIIGRYGGEEFCIILSNFSRNETYLKAEEIRDKVAKNRINLDDGDSISITVSIGISDINEGINNLAELIKQADLKLYTAKETGKNKVSI